MPPTRSLIAYHLERYPHVYGPLDPSAITEVHSIARDATGAFLPIEQPDRPLAT